MLLCKIGTNSFYFYTDERFGIIQILQGIMDGFRRKNILEDFTNKTFCLNTLYILFSLAPKHHFYRRAATVNSLLSEDKQV